MSTVPVRTTTTAAGISFRFAESTDPAKPFFLPGANVTTLVGGVTRAWAKNLKTSARFEAPTVNVTGPKEGNVIFGPHFVPAGRYLVETEATPIGGNLDTITSEVWDVTESASP